jgi:hypothetical protein
MLSMVRGATLQARVLGVCGRAELRSRRRRADGAFSRAYMYSDV